MLWHVWRDTRNRQMMAAPAREEDHVQGTPFRAPEHPKAILRLVRASFIVDPTASFDLPREQDAQFRETLTEAVCLVSSCRSREVSTS